MSVDRDLMASARPDSADMVEKSKLIVCGLAILGGVRKISKEEQSTMAHAPRTKRTSLLKRKSGGKKDKVV